MLPLRQTVTGLLHYIVSPLSAGICDVQRYLCFVQLQRRGDLYPPRPRQIFVEVKLFLEFC